MAEHPEQGRGTQVGQNRPRGPSIPWPWRTASPCPPPLGRCAAFIVTGIVLGVAAAACGGGDGPQGNPTPGAVTETPATPTPTPESGLAIDVAAMGAFFEQGQPVNLVLAITAYGPETLYYRTSQRYDFVVKAPAGEEIWRWSLGQEFTEEAGEETLDKGESVKYGAVWDQKDDDGNPVASGTYFLVGESPHCDRTYGSCGTSSAPKAINITITSE